MAEIICVIGTKGGSGKTTVTHLLCHGLSLLGHRAACVMTDEYREPLRPENRRYVMADARSPEVREKVVGKLRDLPGWIGVLDGGANRTETDVALYELADLVLLPFRDSAEDIRVLTHDLELFPRALALPSQWPQNRWQREAAQKLLDELPDSFRERILTPVPALSASKLLLQTRPPETLPSALNSAARALAKAALEILED
ncbi:MAG: hypothetical protein CGU28_14055 [Candidatus Dactylopiibacterium carminicum]|uniref:ParA family protein n=1 Tax=Candidatus Dactylopiibacterium carminicum TaxID=857335 RepID=A0A272ETE0_9RHOO|nr:ParA family protein [Candidatus Dactylopiibacterium carminicum]KAF7599325.1 ParA family protein [Candidatus Dactylopiibacterium carminicum]PAS93316.1 MAG: hypothetical protein CGU29_08250 [Candidatus Dactylopiibacterium carminicum]PAS94338.1 MAG: hypothetical protein CGU28_14055 [Candidatus Dactylopiibacterium carminicum]PAS99328.1 MAG: hypothetical protein BSR46_08635 [Candidatus Dactylopiibacterium carminicum]